MFIVSELSRPHWVLSAAVCAVAVSCGPGDTDVVRRPVDEGSGAPASGEIGEGPTTAADGRRTVVFLGTSLTAGLGLESTEQAYPALVQTRIDAAGLPYKVVNAGVSGDTSAGGLRRIGGLLTERVAVVVIELGANDGLRGLDPGELESNLVEIVRRIRAHDPDVDVILAGMEAPTNMGPDYTASFRAVFRRVAREHELDRIPFLLEGVAGVPDLNQEDRIHPTATGHQRIAQTAWRVLRPVLEARAENGEHP